MKARIMAIPYTKSLRGGSWGHKRQRGCDGGDDYVYYYIGERLKLDGEGEYWRLSEEAERQWYSGPVPAPNLWDVKMGATSRRWAQSLTFRTQPHWEPPERPQTEITDGARGGDQIKYREATQTRGVKSK